MIVETVEPTRADVQSQFEAPLSDYLEDLLFPLFDAKNGVSVKIAWSTPYQVSWEVMVPEPMIRFALGKQGATVNAIRTLMRARAGTLRRALGFQQNVMVDVHIACAK
jgi:predicted RNA-binding protein YlqC (UPF0109 family)